MMMGRTKGTAAGVVLSGLIGWLGQAPIPRDFTAEHLFTNNIEGPDVDRSGRLFVVNVEKDGTIGLVHADGRVEKFVDLPAGSTANAIKFNRAGKMLLADYTGHNVLLLDPATRKVSVYVHRDDFNQPNDLAITKDDVLFASDPHWASGTGKLWRIDPAPGGDQGVAVLLEDKMGTTNGIELSPDERTLYVAESVQRRIWSYDVDARGQLANKRVLITFPDFGLDGIKCDRDGSLYVTRHGKGTIAVISPRGDILREIRLKGTKPSNLVLGGTDGRTVFVTLQDRGAIESFRVEVPGRNRK
jgi:sugar lactone lactonase YvrE